MRVLICLLLFVPLAAATTVDLEVSLYPRSTFAGDVQVSGLDHAISSGTTPASLTLTGEFEVVTLEGTYADPSIPGILSGDQTFPRTETARSGHVGAEALLTSQGMQGIQFRSGSLAWSSQAAAHAGIATPDDLVAAYSNNAVPLPYVDALPGFTRASLIYASTGPTTWTASGAFVFEVFAWSGTVGDEAVDSGFTVDPVHAGDSTAYRTKYLQFHVSDGELTATVEGTTRGIAATSSLEVAGLSRLTLVEQTEGIELTSDGTWDVEGNVSLAQMTPSEGRAQALLVGDITGLSVDGTPVALANTEEIVAAVAGGIGLLAALAIAAKVAYSAALFTRLSPDEALEHERRRLLYDYIKAHPGATFRELQRETGIPAGTARHHLSVLERSTLIIEKGHRSTVRFFENHGKFDTTWDAVVLLREPDLEAVHTWLADHPGTIQKALLDHAAAEWGWSRSTTQHRLQRLVDGGIVTVRNLGRRKSYEAHAIVQRPQPMRY